MRPQAVSVGEIVPVEGGGHIVKATGRKDRHSKVYTARGLRDRRVRLSALTAIQFYDVQDRLGFDRPSKAVDWLMKNAKTSIDELTPSSSSAVPVPVPLPEPAAPSAGTSRSRDKAKQPEPEPDPDPGPEPQSQAQTAGGGGGEPTSSSSGSERFLSLQQQQHQHQFSSQEEPPAPVHSHHVHHLVMQNHGAAVAGGFISQSCDAVQTELPPQSVYQALLLQSMAAGGMFQEPPGPSRFRTPGSSFPPSSQFARSATAQQFPQAETLRPWMPATPQQQQQQQQQFGFGFGFGVGVGVGAGFRKETLQSSSGPAFLAGSSPHHLHPHLPQQQQQFFQNHQFMVSPQGPSAVAASFSGGGGAGGFSGFRIPGRIQGIDEQDGGGGTAESKPPSAASSSSHFG